MSMNLTKLVKNLASKTSIIQKHSLYLARLWSRQKLLRSFIFELIFS